MKKRLTRQEDMTIVERERERDDSPVGSYMFRERLHCRPTRRPATRWAWPICRPDSQRHVMGEETAGVWEAELKQAWPT